MGGARLLRVLISRGALEDFELLAFFELVEVLAFARRREVHVEFSTSGAVGLYRYAGAVFGKLLKAVIDLLRHQAALFDPALLSLVGLHPKESTLLLENFDSLAVLNCPHFAVESGDAVAQAGFSSRDVHVFVMFELGLAAPDRKYK